MGAVWSHGCMRVAAVLVAGGGGASLRADGPDITLAVLVAAVVVPWLVGFISPAAARAWKIGLLVAGLMAAASVAVDAAEFAAAQAVPPAVLSVVGGAPAAIVTQWQSADWTALHPTTSARGGAAMWVQPLGSGRGGA